MGRPIPFQQSRKATSSKQPSHPSSSSSTSRPLAKDLLYAWVVSSRHSQTPRDYPLRTVPASERERFLTDDEVASSLALRASEDEDEEDGLMDDIEPLSGGGGWRVSSGLGERIVLDLGHEEVDGSRYPSTRGGRGMFSQEDDEAETEDMRALMDGIRSDEFDDVDVILDLTRTVRRLSSENIRTLMSSMSNEHCNRLVTLCILARQDFRTPPSSSSPPSEETIEHSRLAHYHAAAVSVSGSTAPSTFGSFGGNGAVYQPSSQGAGRRIEVLRAAPYRRNRAVGAEGRGGV